MRRFDIDDIKKFYDETDDIWPDSDIWHKRTNQRIKKFLEKTRWATDSYVLNAGSGGNNYGLPYNFHHVDISANRMEGISNFTIANVEKLPFDDSTFDHSICVGSVLNYCDAVPALSELSRVLKTGGEMILEFENSWSYRYKRTKSYGVSAGVATIDFRDTAHTQWIYSEKYIISLCSQYKFTLVDKERFHIISSLALIFSGDENKSAKYFCLDGIARALPLLSRHSNNIIFRLKKVCLLSRN